VTDEARPNWDRYFLDLCEAVARRATCDRGKCGCVIVKDKRIMTTGYVGAPAGLPHCDEAGHDMRKVIDENGNISQHCVRTLHAEQNAIIQAARFGIKRVVCEKRYHADADTIELFKQAGVELSIMNDEVEKYDQQ
jgi:dCMP deaminase